MMATRSCALDEHLPGALQIGDQRDGIPQYVLLHQPFINDPRHELHYPKEFPGSSHRSGSIHLRQDHQCRGGGRGGGCSPQAFQKRVLPVCKWMPALLGNVFFKRLKISRVRPGDDKMNTSSRNAKRNSPGSGKLLHLFHRIVQTETEQRWHEVTLFRPLHDVQCCAARHPRPPTRASLVARVQLWQTVSYFEETAPPTVSTASCSESR